MREKNGLSRQLSSQSTSGQMTGMPSQKQRQPYMYGNSRGCAMLHFSHLMLHLTLFHHGLAVRLHAVVLDTCDREYFQRRLLFLNMYTIRHTQKARLSPHPTSLPKSSPFNPIEYPNSAFLNLSPLPSKIPPNGTPCLFITMYKVATVYKVAAHLPIRDVEKRQHVFAPAARFQRHRH